jgi:hypothetical protein
MDKHTVFPNPEIINNGIVSEKFLSLGVKSFHEACARVHGMPYGSNSTREDILILFKENKGSCTTKHSVIASLAAELNIQVNKNIGVYGMNDHIVTGTGAILEKYNLPYIPMTQCFLAFDHFRVDLTEGNFNGKNHSVEEFLHIEKVAPNTTEKDEYLIYRKVLSEKIMAREEMKNHDMAKVLEARQEGIKLLRSKVGA